MTAACCHPLPLYRPRDPQASDLWRLVDRHFDTFQRVYLPAGRQAGDERFQAKYGYWRPIIERSVTAFLRCGDLHGGFARVRCGDCGHEMFVAFSCKQRCTCPSCHQKRTLLTAIHVAEEVCAPVAHRQVVLTIPKRLRVHTRFDRKLLGKLCAAAWACIQAEVRRQLGRDDVVPGMIAAIQTHGELVAEFTQHIPPKGSHTIRYYGFYSNKARGMRRKAAEAEGAEQAGAASSSEASEPPAPSRCSQTWAMLIKRVYEVDPLRLPEVPGPDEGGLADRTAPGGRHREDSPSLRAEVAGRRLGQPADFIRAVRGTDLRRDRRVPGDLPSSSLILPSRQVGPLKVRLCGNAMPCSG